MKPCPYCAEEIQDAAIVCKHCGRDLKPPADAMAPARKKRRRIWPWIVAGGVLLVWLFGRPPQSRLANTQVIPSDVQQKAPNEVVSTATSADRRADLQAIVVSAGDVCTTVTRTFHQGTDKAGNQMWNVACEGGRRYAVQIKNDRRGSTSVLSCDVLEATTRVRCFQAF